MSQAQPKTRQSRKQEDKASGRQRMGGASQNLTVEGVPPTHKARWFNHKKDRILQARKAGYQPVLSDEGELGDVDITGRSNSDMGTWRRKRVGTQDGAPLYAYLMAIKKEWYDEDKAAKMGALDESEQALRQAPPPGSPADPHRTVKQADIQTNVPLRR